tara:strand:+ start:2276 stop:2626 length:351 start_codon:yes stop_codon:yes gene_type:complete
MSTKKEILSKFSWKKLKSTHHFFLIFLCLYIYIQILGFYLDFIRLYFPKDSIFIVLIFAIPIVFLTTVNISAEGVRKRWRFSPSATQVIISIYFYTKIVGWLFLISLLSTYYKDIG